MLHAKGKNFFNVALVDILFVCDASDDFQFFVRKAAYDLLMGRCLLRKQQGAGKEKQREAEFLQRVEQALLMYGADKK